MLMFPNRVTRSDERKMREKILISFQNPRGFTNGTMELTNEMTSERINFQKKTSAVVWLEFPKRKNLLAATCERKLGPEAKSIGKSINTSPQIESNS
ncbi:unnamed protein product [Nezara viridula]|uniref:Uncharacterized protein n=1 Tax=Nezara viridula TaxID=85310 RepID=A0A9P0E1Z2_NEZVI|nr:unnamed protein product [Nezara viridula]